MPRITLVGLPGAAVLVSGLVTVVGGGTGWVGFVPPTGGVGEDEFEDEPPPPQPAKKAEKSSPRVIVAVFIFPYIYRLRLVLARHRRRTSIIVDEGREQ